MLFRSVVFRSRRRHGDENGRHRSNEGGDGPSHMAKESGRMGPPLSLLGLPFVRFLGSYFFLPKNDPRKFLGHEEASGRRIDANGATRAQMVYPTRPRNLATWATPLSAFGPPLFSILFLHALFLPKNDPRKFSGHLDVVWVTETSKYRK